MIIPPKYLPVNWADGMKVTRNHFDCTENFVIDNLRDVASVHVNKFNFGLLPPLASGGAMVSDYEVTRTATGQLQISIHYCQAITPGGVRISIVGEGIKKNLSLSDLNESGASDENDDWSDRIESLYVVIVADPFKKTLVGDPDPEEIPIRHPFTQSYYSVELKNNNEIRGRELGMNHLIIGRLHKTGNSLEKDATFVPPSSTINSCVALIEFHRAICNRMNDLQNISLQIVHKINYKNQKSIVSQNVKAMCNVLLQYCAENYFAMRNMVASLPPVYLLNAISVLANKLLTFIKMLPENEKEELLNYFFEWSDITQVNFLKILDDTIEINYDHYDSGNCFVQSVKMLEDILIVWNKLNSLEFIGQHKESIIVKEEVITNVVKEKKGWSILD
ncbi:hypothetical protein QTN47_09130 [Danxiaibacter flavus]|uniref:Type VI secretion system baseplate subunit TssK n=1 Tax=Danxiaibacter flavus TaxID=3049108 RepID=A0ABV3ZCS3_9BACT|nr:hypothetical protein QNM32_09130 [Chitinophagaceae bacterium DXS]